MNREDCRLQIDIRYQTVDGNNHLKSLTEEEYYEPDGTEEISINSLPRFDHAHQYLNIPEKELKFSKLNIVCGYQKIFIYETFWNDGENFFIETIYDTETEKFHGIIIQSRISDSPPVYEIMRFDKKDGETHPIFHVFDKESDDGVEETKIYPK